MSTAKFSTWLNPDGTENYKCRAWVNFNGTGTVAIRASGNVSSITDLGTGSYQVNFNTAMPDANFSAIASRSPVGSAADASCATSSNTVNSVLVQCGWNGSSGATYTFEDPAAVSVAIFR